MKEKKSILLILVIFAIISIINLYNAKYLNSYYHNYYIKQIIWFIIGFLIIKLSYKIKFTFLFNYSRLIYIINNILLALVLIIGKIINGTKAWIDLGVISFQPSEFMKISLLLLFCSIINEKSSKTKKIIKMVIYTFIPSLLVFLEPDTGAIIFYLITLICFLFFLKINYKYYLVFMLLIIFFFVSFILLYKYNQNILIDIFGTNIFYRMDRIINFKTNNYQLDLALISIYAAPLIRNGLGKILLYIPEGPTDFIFAFCVGNFGLLLGIIIIVLYILLFVNLIKLRRYSHNKKTNYFIISFLWMFLIQVLINITMNIGLIPIIGITLPYLSYGGSSLLIYFIFIAIIFNQINMDKVQVHNKNKNNWPLDDMD